jgi:hypothetical protein
MKLPKCSLLLVLLIPLLLRAQTPNCGGFLLATNDPVGGYFWMKYWLPPMPTNVTVYMQWTYSFSPYLSNDTPWSYRGILQADPVNYTTNWFWHYHGNYPNDDSQFRMSTNIYDDRWHITNGFTTGGGQTGPTNRPSSP